MSHKAFLLTVLISFFLGLSPLQAGTCLTGGCHQALTEKKYIHGPVAAEQAGVTSCVTCHVPAGKKCSESEAGSFNPMVRSSIMCRTCHAGGNDTLHTVKEIDCLECHDPHGSDTSPIFERSQQ